MLKQLSLVGISACFILQGCGETDPDAPPKIKLGDSVCIECGMIVSDERYGTATMIEGERGVEPLIFDDFNCQKNFELKHEDLVVVTRWSRDRDSLEWFHTQDGWFVHSPKIQTPMASNMAAFNLRESAEQFAQEQEADLKDFTASWAVEQP